MIYFSILNKHRPFSFEINRKWDVSNCFYVQNPPPPPPILRSTSHVAHFPPPPPLSGKFGLVLDFEPCFLIEFKCYNPHCALRPAVPFQITRLHHLPHIKQQLCKTFSVPFDRGSLLCAQVLPRLKLGLLVLKVNSYSLGIIL